MQRLLAPLAQYWHYRRTRCMLCRGKGYLMEDGVRFDCR
jgi:hypothetical protein